MKNVQIDSRIGILTGTLVSPENKSNGKAVLFIHGWESSQEGYIPRAQALAALGFTCLTFNLPGHGTSEGDMKTLTRREYLDCTISAYDYLANQEQVHKEYVGVVGASFGAYLGALLTKERLVQWLVLRAPANYEDEGFETLSQRTFRYEHPDMVAWREKVLDYTETVALEAIHAYKNEILIVESEKDIIVPHQSVENYLHAVSNPAKLTHIVMKNADHQLSTEEQKEEFIRILVAWFKHA